MEDEMEYEWNPDWKPPVEKHSHKYTFERLYHFTCGECLSWWSYASLDNGTIPIGYEMNCPHCGYKSYLEPKEED